MLLVNLPLVWLLVPAAPPRGPVSHTNAAAPQSRPARWTVVLLGAFFALRWFITSAIAVHVLSLLGGIGLSESEAVGVAALIGPGQVAGRIMEWIIGPRINVLMKARIGALLFPVGAALLMLSGIVGSAVAATGFALLYGMSNGIMTINRGTLPLAMFGPGGYARMLGWLAVPVLLAQATAPTLTAPLINALPARDVLLICGAGAAVGVLLLLLLRLPTSAR
jgi:hypothetical protein